MSEFSDSASVHMGGWLGCQLGPIAINFGLVPNMLKMLTTWLTPGLELLFLVD